MLAKVPSRLAFVFGFILIPFVLKNSVVFIHGSFIVNGCRFRRRRPDDGVPLSVCGNRSDFSTCILAIVCDGTGVVMADEWKGMYDGGYGSFVVEGDAVFCTRR